MKRTLFFFVGGVRLDDPRYSHGVRQAILQLNSTPGASAPGCIISTAMHAGHAGCCRCDAWPLLHRFDRGASMQLDREASWV